MFMRAFSRVTRYIVPPTEGIQVNTSPGLNQRLGTAPGPHLPRSRSACLRHERRGPLARQPRLAPEPCLRLPTDGPSAPRRAGARAGDGESGRQGPRAAKCRSVATGSAVWGSSGLSAFVSGAAG
jgi:hypothetical protein